MLAGDALLTLALELLASHPEGPSFAARRLESVLVAARRAGVEGLVGGQAADLEGEESRTDREQLHWIHRHKTAALFAGSAEIGVGKIN